MMIIVQKLCHIKERSYLNKIDGISVLFFEQMSLSMSEYAS